MRIVWTEPAIEDAENLKAYITQDSEVYAIGVLEKIFEVVDELSIFPRLGRVVPEFQDPDIREVFAYNYRIIYCLKGESIYILTILHATRELHHQDN